LECDGDVIGLLDLLRKMAFNTKSSQEPYTVLVEQVDKFTSIQQGEKERITNYHDRFQAMKKVIKAQWGSFYPSVLAEKEQGPDDADKAAAAQEKVFASIFLRGSNNVELKVDLNNSFLSGNDNYPNTIDEALSLMMHYQDGKGKVKSETMISRDEEIPASGNATSFAQVAEKRTCFKCGKKGHIKANCPLKNNNQSSNY